MSPIDRTYGRPFAYDLNQLRYVKAIVHTGNMTAAAKELRVTQPTLSSVIRDLEARLRTTLFTREARGMRPTETGARLARTADDVFALLRQTEEEIQGFEASPSGHFLLGCYHSFGALFLPPLLRGLGERAPGIELSFWEGIGPKMVEAVLQRTIHFGVGVTSGVSSTPPPDLVQVPFFRDVVALVRGPARPPEGGSLFFVPRVLPCLRVVEAMRKGGAFPWRLVECGDLELVKSLVLSGAGVGVLPWRVATHAVPEGAVRLVDPKLPYEIDTGCLFHRADFHRTRSASLLREEILRAGAELDAFPLPHGVPPVSRAKKGRGAQASARRPPR